MEKIDIYQNLLEMHERLKEHSIKKKEKINMKRNVKKEAIIIGEKELKFLDFAKNCYKSQKRNETFDLYLIKNKKDLTKTWDVIVDANNKQMLKTIEKEKTFETKLTEKVVKFINKMFKKG